MLTPTLIMAGVASALVLVGYYQGDDQHIAGLQVSLKMMVQMMPLLLLALISAGMSQVLAAQQEAFISKCGWVPNLVCGAS